jgi:hypothetical protein
MPLATHASLVLARFVDIRETGPVSKSDSDKVLFLKAAADVRAGNSSARDQRAFKFAILGLHGSEESAREAVANRMAATPWIADALEVWAGVLMPFRHFGEANFLDSQTSGSVFSVTSAPPTEDTPIVILTSVDWSSAEGEAIDRIKRFSDGVTAVRIGMTGLPGLHSQQSFSFPGGFDTDGLTVTMWRNLASAMAFAYGPGMHRGQVKIQREEVYGDRTSFTRCTVVHSEGTWHGQDPLNLA